MVPRDELALLVFVDDEARDGAQVLLEEVDNLVFDLFARGLCCRKSSEALEPLIKRSSSRVVDRMERLRRPALFAVAPLSQGASHYGQQIVVEVDHGLRDE